MGGDFLENRYKCDGKISHCDVPTASACRVPMAKPAQLLTSGIKVLARARCYTEVNTSPYKQDNSETYSEAPIVAKKRIFVYQFPFERTLRDHKVQIQSSFNLKFLFKSKI